ncbi:beta strand repeat-containing protein [Pontibacter sp. CAU 1760]
MKIAHDNYFPANYSSISLDANSTVEYYGAEQTIANRNYGHLTVRNAGTKSLAASTPIAGNVTVNSGTLDLQGFTLNRTTTGGAFNVLSGASLKIGGTNSTFPTNYAAVSLNANSTTDYYGTDQTVAHQTYGNLTLSTSGTKTLPATAMTIAGNFTTQGAVSATAAGNLTVNGNVLIDGTSTFNGGSTSHTVGGNWVTNGTFAPSTSTVTFTGTSKAISGTTSAPEFNNLTINGPSVTVNFPSLKVLGNVDGSGGYKQSANGTLTMAGTAKTISGSNHSFQNLTIDGTVATGVDFSVNGNFTVNDSKSFSASTGTVTMAGASKSIIISGTAVFSGLSIAGATSTSSSFTINSSLSGTSALTATAGTVKFGGTSTFGNSHNLFNVDISGTSLTMLANANLNVAGALTRTGTFNVTANTPNTVTYNGTAAQSVLSTTYHHLAFANGGAKTANGAFTANGDLTVNAGAVLNGSSATHTVAGSWAANGTYNGNTSTVVMSGTGKSISSTAGAAGFNNLKIEGAINTAVNLTLSGDLTVDTGKSFNATAGTVTMNGAGKQINTPGTATFSTLNIAAASSTANGFTINAALSGVAKLTASAGKITFNGAATTFGGGHDLFSADVPAGRSLTLSANATLGINGALTAAGTLNATANGCTIDYKGSGAQDVLPINYHNLSFSTGGTKKLGVGITGIAGAFTLTNAAADATTNAATVDYNGSGTQAVTAIAYHHLAVSKTSGTATYAAATAHSMTGALTISGAGKLALDLPVLNVAGNVRIDAGTLETVGNSELDLKGNWTVGGAFIPNTGTITFSGAAAQTLAPTAFHHLKVNKAASSLTTTGNITLGGDLQVLGGTLVLDGHTLNRSSEGGTLTLADNATLRLNNAAVFPSNFTANNLGDNSHVIYSGGTGGIASRRYGNLTFQDVSARAFQGNATIANTMTVSSGSTLNNAAVDLTLSKSLVNNGTISASSTNLIFDGAASTLSGTGTTTTLGGLTVKTGASLTISQNINLHGNLLHNGTNLYATANKIDLAGSNPASISGTGVYNISELRISKGGATTTVSLGKEISGLQSVNIASGTLDLGASALTKKATGGTTFLLSDGATIKVGGSQAFPDFGTYTLKQTSTVVYNGSTQTVKPLTYGNLALQNAGTKTFGAGTTSVFGAFTLTDGAAADLLSNSSVLNFNGTEPQTMPGLDYHGVLASGGGKKTLEANATIVDKLELTGGNVATGPYKFVLGNAATISESGSHYVTGAVETTRTVTTTETFGNMGMSMTPTKGTPGELKLLRLTGASGELGNGNNIQRAYLLQPTTPNKDNRVNITMSYFGHELKDNMVGKEEELIIYWSDRNDESSFWRTMFPSATPAGNQVRATDSGYNGYFTIGRQDSPLPVELTRFTAARAGVDVVLAWATAMEEDNAGFGVEVSEDGRVYRTLGFVPSKRSTSETKQEYTYADQENGKHGVRYYRLRQRDLNGTTKLYGPVVVDFGDARSTTLVAYPNPFRDQVKLGIEAITAGLAKISLQDIVSKELFHQDVQVRQGATELPLLIGEGYAHGVYVLNVELNGKLYRYKLIRE